MRRSAIFCLFLITVFFVNSPAMAAKPKTELLWPNGAPGAKGDKPDDKPTFTIWLPEKEEQTGAAMVVCPGGGYRNLATDHEGVQIAKWLNSLGVTALVLEYRHNGKGYQHPAPLQDAQRAIRTVRARAKEFGVEPNQIGIIGFSAGGHLASSAGTHFDAGNPDAKDSIERVSCRPDFMVLCYPVIAFAEPYTHFGSQHNLLGKNADPKLVESLSSEKQVTKETPPTFLFTTHEDKAVSSENSIRFYLALRKAGVPAELHCYEKGRHGLGLARGKRHKAGTTTWSTMCENWLRIHGWVK